MNVCLTHFRVRQPQCFRPPTLSVRPTYSHQTQQTVSQRLTCVYKPGSFILFWLNQRFMSYYIQTFSLQQKH